MQQVLGFLVVTLCVAALMLLGELLHRIFRVTKTPHRPHGPDFSDLWAQSGEQRYSIRHLERFSLVAFGWFLSFFLLMTAGTLDSLLSFDSVALYIVIIASVGVWWSYRRGVLR
jgi:hypothetical protein